MPLNLNHLRTFITVVDEKGFRQAAKALYISQPAVSRSIQELEKAINLQLLDRTHRTIKLTESGQLLYAYGQRLFTIEREAEEALQQLHNLEQGALSIAASQTIGTYMLPPLLGAFHNHYPGIRLSLDIRNTQEVLDSLRVNRIDLAFVEGNVEHDDFEVTDWRKDHLVIIASSNNRWGLRDRIAPAQLSQLPYIQREQGSGTQETVDQVFAAYRIKPNIVMELGSNEAVIQAVMAGLGISIVSDATIVLERAAGQIIALEFTGQAINREFHQVTLKGRPASPALIAFRKWTLSDEELSS